LVRTLAGHSERVTAVAITPDGTTVVSGSGFSSDSALSRYEIKVWDLRSGRETFTLTGHSAWIGKLAITPDGESAVSACGSTDYRYRGLRGEDLTIRVWDLRLGRERFTLPGHSAHVTDLSMAPDGRTLATASYDGSVKLWDLTEGSLRQTLLRKSGSSARRRVTSIAIETGRVIVATAPGRLQRGTSAVGVWDLETGKKISGLSRKWNWLESIVIAPGHPTRLLCTHERGLVIIDLETGEQQITISGFPKDAGPDDMVATPDGKKVVCSNSERIFRSCTVTVFDLSSGERCFSYSSAAGGINATRVSHDSKYLVVAVDNDPDLRVFDLENGGEPLALSGHLYDILDVAFTPDGTGLVSASSDGSLKLWDLLSIGDAERPSSHTKRVEAIALTSDGRAVSASSDHTLKVWDLQTGECQRTLAGQGGPVKALAVTRDGRVVSACDNGRVEIWGLEGTGLLRTIEFWGERERGHPAHLRAVDDVDVTPDGTTAVSVSWDRLKIWDLETGEELRCIFTEHERLIAVAILPDGKTAICGADSLFHPLGVWDLEKGKKTCDFPGHSNRVTAVTTDSDGRTAITASADSVRVWELATAAERLTLSCGARDVAMAQGQETAVSSGGATVSVPAPSQTTAS
jgi:WD40 repeat protein